MLIKLPELKDGYNVITKMDGIGSNMLQDIGVQKISGGNTASILNKEEETALLLMSGEIVFKWEGNEQKACRNSLFEEAPSTLHVCKGVEVIIEAVTDAEVLVQQTTNENEFESKYYGPEDCSNDIFGEGVWGCTAQRVVRTVFDYSNAPYSNLVIGEVINYSGRWSSYIPHGHDQPEVYYYRYERPEGFGAAFIGDEVFKISDNSALCIPGGPTHPQVTAPGFPMWYAWMIRHLDGNPWTSRDNDPRYEWLLDKDVKIWPEK